MQVLSIVISLIVGVLTIPHLFFSIVNSRLNIKTLKSSDFHKAQKSEVISSRVSPFFALFGKSFFRGYSMKAAMKSAKEISDDIKNGEFRPSIIIGIGRGGAIFGSLISYNLFHLPIFIIDRKYDWLTSNKRRLDEVLFDFEVPPQFLSRVLLVAGEAHSGGTLETFSNYLIAMGASEIKTCVFYKQEGCTVTIDYIGAHRQDIPLMPWQDEKYIRDSISVESSQELKKQRGCISSQINKTVYVVRHGETPQNVSDKFIGTTDAKLSEEGERQARRVGEYLKGEIGNRCFSIYSSPLDRCYRTAQCILESFQGQNIIHSTNLLIERDYGEWENISRNEIKRKFNSDYRLYNEQPVSFSPPRAESVSSVVKRVNAMWEEIRRDNSEIIVIVTHKTTGRLLCSFLMNTFYSKYRDIEFNNGGVYKFKINGGHSEVHYESAKAVVNSN